MKVWDQKANKIDMRMYSVSSGLLQRGLRSAQLPATDCNTLQHTATDSNWHENMFFASTGPLLRGLLCAQNTAAKLQHIATLCNTLQLT